MRHADRHHFDADRSLLPNGAIEQGMHEGRRLRAQYVRHLIGKIRNIGQPAS
jgi:hypothetical protein